MVDGRAGDRQLLARQIVLAASRRNCILPLQAVSEFYAAVSRKRIVPAELAAARANDWLTAFRCVPATAEAVRAALTLASSGRASYWDALLLTTAARADCRVILTEDMQDGAIITGVQIHNPFTNGAELTEFTRQLLDL